MKRFLCLIAVLCVLLSGSAWAEELPVTTAVVKFDRMGLDGWTPGYGLSMPGVLLELSHSEGMVSVSAMEAGNITPQAHLSRRLDLAAESLAVSDARIVSWANSFGKDGRCLSFSYTYPDGDEIHLCRIWTTSFGNMLIELHADTWGMEAEVLMESVYRVFIEDKFSLTMCANPFELTATLSDVIVDEQGRTLVQLSASGEKTPRDNRYYPLSENAVILFPNSDEPTILYPVAPDMAALSDAIWTYEESSDSPAVFYSIIENDEIIYMEYSLMI